ncbi:response regulator [Aureimonas endophytica]|uniref:Response regulator n=1 Tax=Aureimonas endophytica TaxID=2027858 RepID=A0A916ZFM2_9HYPH|nr:response regulator [Aureimonas endophytica]GGD94173.1 response regulator [Aureimonas endophytica]
MRICLVIDDSSVVRKVASRILSSFGFTMVEAATGAEGLVVAGEAGPALVLVAANLSDMPGEDFVRKFRALPAHGDAPVVGLLVESNLGQMTRLKRAGASAFVLKPFDRASLSMRLQPYLSLPAAA